MTTTQYAVRNKQSGWVYALPRHLPGRLVPGTWETAVWHLRSLAGRDVGDQSYFEIVRRDVSPWEVVS